MSSGLQQGLHKNLQASSSTPNFQPIFEQALEEYKRKTGNDLTAHPLAAEINGCDSPNVIHKVLERKANELKQSRSPDQRLTQWVAPTAFILNVLSAILDEGVGSTFIPTKIILSGIGILLVVSVPNPGLRGLYFWQGAKDTVANHGVLVKLFDKIRSVFEYLKIYTQVPSSPAVTDELAKGIMERRTKLPFGKAAGMNDDIKDALERLGELEQREHLTGIIQASGDTAVLEDDAKKTKVMVKEIGEKMGARDWKEILQKLKQWLSPPDASTNHTFGLRAIYEETATWFLGDRIFQEWHSTGSLLWINGKAGSGKSILCSTIIQRILSLSDRGRSCLAYFYFDFGDENKKHLHNLLPSLLLQFATHSIPFCNIISHVYSVHGNGMRRPGDEVLINCLTDMVSATPQRPTYIILDAIDECPNTSGVQSSRERVLSLINELVNLRLPNLHICVTSRPEIDIRMRLEPLASHCVSLHAHPGHKEYIAKYISSKVDVIGNDKRWRESDKKLAVETLSEKADGMFRWVFCQLEMLKLCSRSSVRRYLSDLPKSLDETYERALMDIHKVNRGHFQRLFQSLAVAIRPLRVDEAAAILTLDPRAIEGDASTLDADSQSEDEEQEVLFACPGMITIVDGHNSRVIQFSHSSVQDFLTSERLATSPSEAISRYYILPEAAHTTLAQVSLGVLLRLDKRANRRNATRIPLIWYSTRHWVSHAQFGSVSSRVMDAMKTLFDSDKPHFAAWLRIYDMDSPSCWNSRWNAQITLYYSALGGRNSST